MMIPSNSNIFIFRINCDVLPCHPIVLFMSWKILELVKESWLRIEFTMCLVRMVFVVTQVWDSWWKLKKELCTCWLFFWSFTVYIMYIFWWCYVIKTPMFENWPFSAMLYMAFNVGVIYAELDKCMQWTFKVRNNFL